MTLTMTAPEIGQNRKLTTRLALVLEYDGTNYSGFQWQANVPSIQGTLENARGETDRRESQGIGLQ